MNKIYIILVAILLIFSGFWYFNNDSKNQFSSSVSDVQLASESQIVELKDGDTYNLTASIVKKVINGAEVKMLAYNGSIPGPTLKVKKGSEITINFTNNTDVPTTLHSHGIRLENKYDGVPDVTQKEIGVGKSFTYKIKFPDEGVFWYHPHIREDYAQELGLYGNYIVVSDDPNYYSPVNQEVPLVVDDILIENGKVAGFSSVVDHALMGRYGNTVFVNGREDYSLSVKKGDVVRFYITNTANTRVFNLAFSGAKIKLVGGDNGKYERESYTDSLLIAPSERVVVEVLFDSAGQYKIEHKTPSRVYTIGVVNVSEKKADISYKSQFQKLRTNDDTIRSIDPFRQYFDRKADKNISFTIDMSGMSGMHMMPDGTMMSNGGMHMGGVNSEKIEWEDSMAMMNTGSTVKSVKWKIVDDDTKNENEKINWKFKVGDVVKIKIYNDPKSMHPMQHPFHIHGQKFLVLSVNGVKNTSLVWKDTVLVQKGDTVEILVDMKNPGRWMAHCHIAEHLESGMMFEFDVE